MRSGHAVAAVVGAWALAAMVLAQNPASVLNLTATTANVAGAPDSVRIEILRWSTDEERQRLLSAWTVKPPPAAAPAPGRGAAKQGKGAAKGAPVAAVVTPDAALTSALQEAPTVGYLWSSEIAGYALRYAGKVANPDGSQRIVLITQRRLGAANQLWKPSFEGEPNSYEFSVIELRLNAKGEGEGRASLTGKIAPDDSLKIVTIENMQALPAVLRDVRVPSAHP